MDSTRKKCMPSLAVYLILLLLTPPNVWAEPPQTCTVRGRVVNAVGNQPLKNARVQLKSRDDPKRFYNVTTDAEGQFTFAQVVPARDNENQSIHCARILSVIAIVRETGLSRLCASGCKRID
jgi:hypothetical protein